MMKGPCKMSEHKYRNGSEKVSLKDAVRYTLRGIRIICKTQPVIMEVNGIQNAANGVIPMVVLYFSSRIITELAGNRDVSQIVLYVALTLGTIFLTDAINQIAWYIEQSKGYFLFWQRYSRFEGIKFAEMDYKYVEDASVYQLREEINLKANANGLGLSRVYGHVPWFFGEIVSLVAAAMLVSGMFVENPDNTFINSPWVIILLLLATIAVPAFINSAAQKRLNRLLTDIFAGRAQVNTGMAYHNQTYIRNFASGKDVRVFGLKDSILNSLDKYLSWYKGKWKRAGREINGITAAAGIFFSVLTYLVIGLRALSGMYDIGEVTRYVGAVAAFSASVVGIVNGFTSLYQNAPYLAMLYDYLDLPSQKYMGSLDTEKCSDCGYEIEFKDVSFKYPGTDTYVLKNLNLKINAGERLAVVGRNGSGKTTMIKLLCRLYDPTEGVITLNGVDIKKYILDEYTRIFTVVFQDFTLMHLPLGENVAAVYEYDETKVKQALEKIGFGPRLTELESLEKGLKTPLHKGADNEGINISGGEEQKIALARAVYKDAPFLILDEPTAALDPLAEYEIYLNFNKMVEDKSAIFISHRLSSCRFCDNIAVFKDGELAQLGSHEILTADMGGEYYKLWTAQAQHYIEEITEPAI
jgi:ATP-binding cassette subfamily B protein